MEHSSMSTRSYWLVMFSGLYILADFLHDILSIAYSGLLMSSTISMAIYKHFCTCFGYKNGFIFHTQCFLLFSPNNVLWKSIPVNHNKTLIHCFNGCILLHGVNASELIPQFDFGALTIFNSIVPSYNSTGLLNCNSELDKAWWLETHSR